MYRGTHFIIWISLLVLPGCFNRSGGGPLGTSARVPAPGTYQLKIPTLSNQTPYYTPNQNSQVASHGAPGLNPPAATINPNAAAPTLSIADRNLQGWKLLPGQSAPASHAPVYHSPHGEANRSTYAPPNYQVASGSTLTRASSTGSGANLASPADPRIDSSRMAAIDASGIRPPSTTVLDPGAIAQAPAQYFGTLQSGAGNPANSSSGFTQPNLPNRYAAQPVVGVPGTYQSPYIRNTGTFAPGPEQRNAPGWVARENTPTNR